MKLIRWLKRLLRMETLPFDIGVVERRILYHFKDPEYLYQSLKHRSYSQAVDGTTYQSNERLEFLGDAILNMVVSHHVFTHHPDCQEGDLTTRKSGFVNKLTALNAGRSIGLDRFILLNESEENAGVRNRSSIIADAYEAVIGAIYLDGGYGEASAFVYRTILTNPDICRGDGQENYKSRLQEYAQANRKGHPEYRTISEKGPDHKKMFTVTVSLDQTVI
ncbi:ribonuclease III, partial [Candidatus Latescibacterota bacterium]